MQTFLFICDDFLMSGQKYPEVVSVPTYGEKGQSRHSLEAANPPVLLHGLLRQWVLSPSPVSQL